VSYGIFSSVCQRSGLCTSSGLMVEACDWPWPACPQPVKRMKPFSRIVSSVVSLGRMP
jgi:hypothetical protein